MTDEADLHKPKAFQQTAFSLIEVLTVVAVIAILVLIAIPRYRAYRASGIDSQMKSDIKNAATALESYYTKKLFYTSMVSDLASFGFRQTDGVSVSIIVTSPQSFTVTGSKSGGSKANFTYDSATGNIF